MTTQTEGLKFISATYVKVIITTHKDDYSFTFYMHD